MCVNHINHPMRYVLRKIQRRLANTLKRDFAKLVRSWDRCQTSWVIGGEQMMILSLAILRFIGLTPLWHKIEHVSGKLRRWVDWYWSAIIRTAKAGYGQVHGTEMLSDLLRLLERYGDRLPLEVSVCCRNIASTLNGRSSVEEWRKTRMNLLALQQVGDQSYPELRSYRWTPVRLRQQDRGCSRPKKNTRLAGRR